MTDASAPGSADCSFRCDLRGGGWVGVAGDALVVHRPGEPLRVPLADVVEVTARNLDWFLVVLGLLVVGFGVVSLDRSVPLGLGFVAVGVGSLYLTYRKRDEMKVRVAGRAKPLTLYPDDPEGFYDAVEDALDRAD